MLFECFGAKRNKSNCTRIEGGIIIGHRHAATPKIVRMDTGLCCEKIPGERETP